MKRPLLKSRIMKDYFNRPLTGDEKENHLPQKQRSPCAPWYQNSVIRMNSTFLECPDVMYSHRGMATIFMLPLLLMMLGTTFFVLFIIISDWSNIRESERIAATFLLFAMPIGVGLLSWAMLWLICRECFRYTHYPMLFNRKTRKVHLFRADGTVMTEDWDKLYFVLTGAILGDRKVSCFRLAEDGETVLEGMVLPFVVDKNEHFLLSQWEFVRRFMEEPDELPHLAGQVENVMDIAGRRESWLHGFQRLMISYSGGVLSFAILSLPLVLLISIGRWIAVQTCTIPVWPEEVEKDCQIEPNDPYLRDRNHLAVPGTVAKPEGARR
jgi:hypothetical protein